MNDRPERMTVGDLIEHLQRFDPALPVMVDGYEMGLDYPQQPAVEGVAVDDMDSPGFFGRFTEGAEFQAVVIHR